MFLPSLYSAGEEGDGLPVTLLEAFLREEDKVGKLTTRQPRTIQNKRFVQ